MKKILIILLSLILIIGIGGYIFAQNNPKVKGALTVNKVLDAKTPAEVKQIIKDNQDVVNELEKQGVLKESDMQTINNKLDEMEKEGKTFDKKELTETYLKDKIPNDQYNKVNNIISKDQLSVSDKAELVNILANSRK